MNMSLVLRLLREIHLCRFSSNVPRLSSVLKLLQNPDVILGKVQNPLCLQQRALFRHLNVQKCSEAERCFDHLYFQTCVAPQWRAIFHLTSAQMALHPPL